MVAKRYRNTKKQREIMLLLVAAAARGEVMTMAELKSKLSYGADVSNQAITGSLTYLEKHGFLRKTLQGPKSMTIAPTLHAIRTYKINHYPEPF